MPVKVDTDHLRLYRDIVAHRSISRGAEMNGISQSAASQHIQELERRMSAVLLDRSTRPFTLTEAGEKYLQLCQDLLHRCEEFDTEMERLQSEVRGTLRVAAIYSVGLSTMTDIESTFRQRHPAAELEITYLRPERVYDSVLSEMCDLGLISYPKSSKEIDVIPWLTETMVLGASPSHPLAVHPRINPELLHGVSFIAFDQDLPIRGHIDEFLEEHQIRVQRTMSFDNIQMIKEALMLGKGVSILPLRMMEAEIREGKLKAIPLIAEGLVRPLGIIHVRKRRFSRAAEAFCEMLQTDFSREEVDVAAPPAIR